MAMTPRKIGVGISTAGAVSGTGTGTGTTADGKKRDRADPQATGSSVFLADLEDIAGPHDSVLSGTGGRPVAYNRASRAALTHDGAVDGGNGSDGNQIEDGNASINTNTNTNTNTYTNANTNADTDLESANIGPEFDSEELGSEGGEQKSVMDRIRSHLAERGAPL